MSHDNTPNSSVPAGLNEVVVAGVVCLDIIPDLGEEIRCQESLFQPGCLLKTGPLTFATGGAVANVGGALHRLGCKTRLVGKVGSDFAGEVVLSMLRSVDPGLTSWIARDPLAATSYSLVVNPAGHDRMFWHHPGVSDSFQERDVPEYALRDAHLFHFGYPPSMRSMYEDDGAELVLILKRARRLGLTTSLDMAVPDANSDTAHVDWRKFFQNVLPHVDLFLPNFEELCFMLERDSFQEILARSEGANPARFAPPRLLTDLAGEALAMGAAVVGIKLGDRGFYLRTTSDEGRLQTMGACAPEDREAWIDRQLASPCFVTRPLGTTGAGDCTIAGFIRGMLEGLPPEEAMTMATAVGACSVEAVDATSGVIDWIATRARVEAGWERATDHRFPARWTVDTRLTRKSSLSSSTQS